jgi:hypothetical protein
MITQVFKYWTIFFILIFYSCEQKEKRKIETTSKDKVSLAKGKELFYQHCFSCHRMAENDGSMFRQIFDRLPEPGDVYFAKFIKGSKALKASGDEYARHLDLEFPSEYEHSFSNLTEREIKELIEFIREFSIDEQR